MDKLSSLFSSLIALAVIGATLIYYSRPEMIITQADFRNVIKQKGYQVSTLGKTKLPILVSCIATKGKHKIIYLGFNSDKEAHKYYVNFIDRFKDSMHSQELNRDIRINKPTAEKQFFSVAYKYYLVIYAKDAVIYSSCNSGDCGDLKTVYNSLYRPIKFNLNNMSF